MRKKIPLFKVFIASEVDTPLLEVLHSGYIGEGEKVIEFEKNLQNYFENPYVTTVNNGTAGLHLAYHMALNQNSPKSYYNNNENEIITTPITCTATNTPIININITNIYSFELFFVYSIIVSLKLDILFLLCIKLTHFW